jgi:peptidoglycan/LPS O-acetylase OafA/YrhL
MLLALAVAINHAGGVYGYMMMDGTYSVQAFYVISGFLITHILLTKYDDKPRGNWLFYSNRALRIFVPYWTVLAATCLAALILYLTRGQLIVAFGLFQQFGPEMGWLTKSFMAFSNIFIVGQDVGLWLRYDSGGLVFAWDALRINPLVVSFNILTPAWTIALELMFYAVAPFLVRRHISIVATIALATFVARFTAYRYGLFTSATAYRFFPFELGLFLVGTLSYRLYQVVRPLLTLKASTITTVLIVAFVLNYWALTPRYYFVNHQYWFYLWVALSLPALFDFARRFPLDRWTGELSYPIYLIHWPVIYVAFAVFGVTDRSRSIAIAASLMLSVALVALVTAPLDRWRERRVKSRLG